MEFVLPPRYWVDLDTLMETTAQGLRDAGALAPRYAGLDVVVATKRFGPTPGATITAFAARDLDGAAPSTPVLSVDHDAVPRPGHRDRKRAWRERLEQAWGKPPLQGHVWADVTLDVPGSLLAPVEVVLDALEPVLGRDPRGRDWQEFFPNDDRIEWLRVRRRHGVALRLEMGLLPS